MCLAQFNLDDVHKGGIKTTSFNLSLYVYFQMPHDMHGPHHRELDQLSIHSNEGSNTDSGRGHSEEGDKRLQESHHGNMLSPNSSRSTHSSLGQYSTPTPYIYYPHLKAHAAAHSYSSNPPQKLRSFAPEESSACTTPTEAYDNNPCAEPHNNTYPRPARVLPAHGNGGYASRAELQNTYNIHANQNGDIRGNGQPRNSEDHNANNTPTLPRDVAAQSGPSGKSLVV